MKKIGITQRIEYIDQYHELRDCLDRRWLSFIKALGFLPIPIPNLDDYLASELLDTLKLDGIILSGGNTLSDYATVYEQTKSTLRDKFENSLIKECINRSIPIIGICRGMQLINVYFGGKLTAMEDIEKKRHKLIFTETYNDIFYENVNSFHNFSICKNSIGTDLIPLAFDEHGYIEAIMNETNTILGIMWHPERENSFRVKDIDLIRRILL